MKSCIMIICSLFIISIGYAQNTEPETHAFSYQIADSVSINITPSADSSWFKQTRPLLGWHWSAGKLMTKNLLMTQGHCYNPDVWAPLGDSVYYHDIDSSRLADSIDLILNIPYLWHWTGFNALTGQQLKYEPTLVITNPGSYLIRQNDSSNAIFGFKYIQGIISNNPSDENYNRLVLKPDLHTGDTILKEPWICDNLTYTGDGNAYNDSLCDDKYNLNPYIDSVMRLDYNGREMYFSINLRRLDTVGIQDTTKVLAIRLPFVSVIYQVDSIYIDSSKHDTIVYDTIKVNRIDYGYINFSSLPMTNTNDTIYLLYNRGIARKIYDVSSTNILYINRNMLPVGTDRDITITAKFICDNNPTNNPHFKPPPNNYIPPHSIDSLKIEVVYLGGDSIGIDWLKFECKVSQDLNRGLYDTTFIENVQHALTHFTEKQFRVKGIRPFRFYTVDEQSDPRMWGSYRYFNKLCGNIGITEINPPYVYLYDYFVNPPNHLVNIGYSTDGMMTPPYNPLGGIGHHIPRGDVDGYKVMGFKWGYKLYGDADTLHSDWETYFPEYLVPMNLQWLRDTATIAQYLNAIASSDGYQPVLEREVKYANFYDTLHNGFLYNGKHWWGQGTYGSDWNFMRKDTGNSYKDTFAIVSRRPDSGEETSELMWSSLIMGCKGFMIDREQTDNRFNAGIDALPNQNIIWWCPEN